MSSAQPRTPSPGMNRYMVRVIQAGVVINQFEAMAVDSCACVQQHIGLVPLGGKLDVVSYAEWQNRCEDELAAKLQRKHRPELYRVPSEEF